MSYEEIAEDKTAWERAARRILLTGPPNSGKSTSFRTFPRPQVVQVYPGEKGGTSIETGEGVKVYKWSAPEVVSWTEVVAETKRLTVDILQRAKKGEVKTFCGDGLHKLYACFLHAATSGASAKGEEFDAKIYSSVHAQFFQYVDMVLRNDHLEYAVFSVWDGKEADDSDAKGKDITRHIFPDLPGQAAKRIMGEFSVVLYHIIEGAGPTARYLWQTKPFGKVWGAGCKMPLAISKALPINVPQDWTVFEPYLIKPQIKEQAA